MNNFKYQFVTLAFGLIAFTPAWTHANCGKNHECTKDCAHHQSDKKTCDCTASEGSCESPSCKHVHQKK